MIEIHSKTTCPACHKAKTYLASRQLDYVEYVYDDFSARQALYDRLNLAGSARTVPQIFFVQNGRREYIGGCDALLRHDFQDRLQMETFDVEF